MRHKFLDTSVDVLTISETITAIDEAIVRRQPLRHVSMNVAKLSKMRSDPELRNDVESASIIGIDGMGIILGLKIMGIPVSERVAGIDLMMSVLKLCSAKGYKPYFLGARIDVVRTAAEQALQRYPGIVFAGVHDGYFTPDEERLIVADIEKSGADCLFLGMPTPAKERFLAKHGAQLTTPFIMGVGGSFDVLAGAVRRAPHWMQRWGLEWLFRIYQEPRRLWRRYAVTNLHFALLLGQAYIQKLTGRNIADQATTQNKL